jgi:hypothetical protein
MGAMDDKSRSRPTTEHIGGGASARLAGVGVALVLLSVVYIGMSDRRGKQEARPPASSGSAVISPASPTARPTPRPTAVPRGLPREEWTPVGSAREDFYGVTTRIGDRLYFGLLPESSPGRMQYTLRLGFPAPAATVQLQIVQLWSRDDRPNYAPVATHELALPPLVRGTERTEVVLLDEVAPKARARNKPRMLQRGYTISVTTETRDDRAYLIMDVSVGGQAGRQPGGQPTR